MQWLYVTECWSHCRILKKCQETQTNDTFSLLKTVTGWDYYFMDRNNLGKKMKEWTMDLLQMTIYALSGKKIMSQLVKLAAIFYAQVHVNVKENDFCAVLTRKQQKSNEMCM